MITQTLPSASAKSSALPVRRNDLVPVSEIKHFFKQRHGLATALHRRMTESGNGVSRPAISRFLQGSLTSQAIHTAAQNLMREVMTAESRAASKTAKAKRVSR